MTARYAGSEDFLDTGVVRYRLLNRVVAYGVCTVFAVWGGPNSVVLSSWADGGQSPVFPVVVASADSVGGFTCSGVPDEALIAVFICDVLILLASRVVKKLTVESKAILSTWCVPWAWVFCCHRPPCPKPPPPLPNRLSRDPH